jgi:hypothetical protein
MLVVCLLSFSAYADSNWQANEGCTGPTYTKLKPGSGGIDGTDPLWHCPTGTGNSAVILATQVFSICFDPHTGSTGGAARVYIRQCVGSTGSSNSCSRLTVDSDFDGILDDVPLDGDNGAVSNSQNYCRYDIPPGYYYIETSVGPGGGETPKVKAQVIR